MSKPKLLWVGDAACPSGFARATHEVLAHVSREYDVTVLGINYRGDPHTYPYPIYAAAAGGDWMGIGRIAWMCDLVQPDIIVLQNDPWNIPPFMRQLQSTKEHKDIPVVGFIAIDGKNCVAAGLNDLAMGIFWTEFAKREARAGGFVKPACVIPLGVDLELYTPGDIPFARKQRGLPDQLNDVFIVGNVNRNQPRKRWDLTLKFFAEWMSAYDVRDAWLLLHAAPTGDTGIKVPQLAKYYGVIDRLMYIEPEVFYGVDETMLADTYRCFDVQVSTTQGEGFGLTTLEGMACGIPQIVPDWSGLGDWARDAAILVPCSTTAVGPPYVNVLGGVPDMEPFVAALQLLYTDARAYARHRRAGVQLAAEPRFRWDHIGRSFLEALDSVVQRTEVRTEVSL